MRIYLALTLFIIPLQSQSQVNCDTILQRYNKYDNEGRRHGKWMFYYTSNCKPFQIDTFYHGVKNGISEVYTEDGFLMSRIPYVNDTAHGVAYVCVGSAFQYSYMQFVKGK